MGSRVAAVTMGEVKKYFHGKHWRFSGLTDSSLEAHSQYYDIEMRVVKLSYSVQIEAVDDPSDGKKGETDDPSGFIKDFLGTGLESAKRHLSATPDDFSELLRTTAENVDSGADPGKAVRRLAVAVDRLRLASPMPKEVEDLMSAMKDEGWKVSEAGDSSEPILQVDISGIYSAEVAIANVQWEYSFKVRGVDGSEKIGRTNDPIQQFRLFYKDQATQDAKKHARPDGKAANPDDGKTVKPGNPKRDDTPTARPEA